MSEATTEAPEPRQRPVLDYAYDERAQLAQNVSEALASLPFYFESKSVVEGLDAADLFSLSAVLGGTIEVQTVATLNRIRNVWDPENRWPEYGFQRFSQTFPDVRLVSRDDPQANPLIGIELKGWYLLSREKAPSYRYTATKAACSPYDLLCVVPWHLQDVLSGVPVVRNPFIESAAYAAEMRNYYWQHQRGAAEATGITEPQGVQPYPPPKTQTSDKPERDGGGNFGRVARVHGLMQEYVAEALEKPISGIAARHWVDFFSLFTDALLPEEVDASVGRYLTNRRRGSTLTEDNAAKVVENLRAVQSLLNGEPQPED